MRGVRMDSWKKSLKRRAALLWALLLSVSLILGGCGAGDGAVQSVGEEILDSIAADMGEDVLESVEEEIGGEIVDGDWKCGDRERNRGCCGDGERDRGRY